MDQYIEFASNHYVLVFAWVCVFFLLAQDLLSNAFTRFETVSPLIAVTKMNNEDTLVLDIREPEEFVKSHIDNAVNIPLSKLDGQLSSLEKHKKNPVIVVCQTGSRSASACKILSNNGFEQVINMSGGMQSWEDNNFPIIKRKIKD
jgi:rhodanese-related sulfurtransferase